MIILSYSFLEILHQKNISVLYFIASAIFMYGFYIFRKKKEDIEKTPIYSYTYSEKINFKYFRNNTGVNKFVHSKIYIIDRKIAYLGSMNFTHQGFSSNFETRVRLTQEDKVKELVAFVHDIFDDDYNFPKHELFFLGKQAYTEEMY